MVPDLLVLDIMLPDSDGNTIVKNLRSMPETNRLPIIMVTAKTSEVDLIRGLDNGADDYIKKLYYYKNCGVREYWIVDPQRKIVTVNYFEGDNVTVQYSFNSVVKVNIYEDLYIDFPEIVKMLDEV